MTELLNVAEKSLRDVTSALSARIQKAAVAQDFEAVAALTKSAARIASFAEGIVDERQGMGLVGDKNELRTFLVRVTEGALRNSYLTVTEGIAKGWLKPGQTLQVELPESRTFSTVVMQANRLQERGQISEFYADEVIRTGDYVEMTELQPGYWTLSPVDNHERREPMLTGELLNQKYKIGAVEARYRRNGVWYHPLNAFPGVLFDASGYVLFNSESEYVSCVEVKKGPDPNHIHVRGGISSLPFYVPLDPPPLHLK